MIKGTIGKVTDMPKRIIATSIGLGAGILSKKLLIGNTHNIIKKMLGLGVELAIAGTVTKNAEEIRNKGGAMIKKMIE